MSAVVKCSKCHPGSLALVPDARGVKPECIGCADKLVDSLLAKATTKTWTKIKAKRKAKP